MAWEAHLNMAIDIVKNSLIIDEKRVGSHLFFFLTRCKNVINDEKEF